THGNHDHNHRQHHQRHHHGKDIRKERRQFPCGQASCHDKVCPKPRQANHTREEDKHHDWVIENDNFFSLNKKLVNVLCCLGEFFIFIIFAHKGFYHANTRDIFLNTGIEFIVFTKNVIKTRHGSAHDKVERSC